MRSYMDIVYVCDEKYVMPTCVSITSLIMNEQTHSCRFTVITDTVSDGAIESIKKTVESNGSIIQIIPVNLNEYAYLYEGKYRVTVHVSRSAIAKFLIADLLPKTDKALYIDSDIVFQRNVEDLFSIDMRDNYIAAVNDMNDIYIDGCSKLGSRIGLEGEYFNSGLMLLNLKKMRADDIPQKLIEYKRNGVNYCVDQDAFNMVLCSRRIKLPYKYNFFTSLFDNMSLEEIIEKFQLPAYESIEKCIFDQSILHLNGRIKPWMYFKPWISDIFFTYYNHTIYKGNIINLKSSLKYLNDIWEEKCKDKASKLTENRKNFRFRFPKLLVPKGSRIVLYGAGVAGKDLYDWVIDTHYCSVVLWVDKNDNNKEDIVHPVEDISDVSFDLILIGISKKEFIKEAYELLMKMGVHREKIVLAFE